MAVPVDRNLRLSLTVDRGLRNVCNDELTIRPCPFRVIIAVAADKRGVGREGEREIERERNREGETTGARGGEMREFDRQTNRHSDTKRCTRLFFCFFH